MPISVPYFRTGATRYRTLFCTRLMFGRHRAPHNLRLGLLLYRVFNVYLQPPSRRRCDVIDYNNVSDQKSARMRLSR